MSTHRNKFNFPRSENRIPMEIPVMLEGHRHLPGVENTFTENVSARGARVISVRHWDKNAQLTLASRSGEFRSSARVAYCHPIHGDGYAIGLEFLESKGRWVVESAN
ncbi:MAG TPA: PilZ domain-containing protein [Methylomirabilota bacterium]|nr:PilZ domain-containing protein [Methylomirabilota bacterium]